MYKIITEGETRLKVPVEGSFGVRGSGRLRKAPVFFNPHMALNRGLTVLVLRSLARDRLVFGDVLSGVGAKGLRAAVEAGAEVYLNDANDHAIPLIRENLILNDVEASVSNLEGNLFMMNNMGIFDFLDIDPFGSPVKFMDAALLASRDGGFLGLTATDTATLCGVYPKTCSRRYLALPLRADFCHEVGMRILIGMALRMAGKYDFSVKPVFGHSTRHYLRVYLAVEHGVKAFERACTKVGYVRYCGSCGSFETTLSLDAGSKGCSCGVDMKVGGPMWLGRLYDKDRVKNMVRLSSSETMENKLLNLVQNEVNSLFYYNIHRLSGALKVPSRPIARVIDQLRDQGYRASRTHFSPISIKTDAGISDIRQVLV